MLMLGEIWYFSVTIMEIVHIIMDVLLMQLWQFDTLSIASQFKDDIDDDCDAEVFILSWIILHSVGNIWFNIQLSLKISVTK